MDQGDLKYEDENPQGRNDPMHDRDRRERGSVVQGPKVERGCKAHRRDGQENDGHDEEESLSGSPSFPAPRLDPAHPSLRAAASGSVGVRPRCQIFTPRYMTTGKKRKASGEVIRNASTPVMKAIG